MKKRICAIMLVVMMIMLSGCGQKDPKELIPGTWTFDSASVSEEWPPIFTKMDNITFFEGDSFSQSLEGEAYVTGEYSMTENTLQITTKIIDGIHSTNTFLFSYEISKNELTLTAEDGSSVVMEKSN